MACRGQTAGRKEACRPSFWPRSQILHQNSHWEGKTEEEACGRSYQLNWEPGYQTPWREDSSAIHRCQGLLSTLGFFFKKHLSLLSNNTRAVKKTAPVPPSSPPWPPAFPKAAELREKAGSRPPSGLRPRKSSRYFSGSRPLVAMATQHLVPNSAPWSLL